MRLKFVFGKKPLRVENFDHTGFKVEAEMSDSAIRWMLRRRLSVKRELTIPWGICDLVGVQFDPVKARRRISCGQTKSIGTTTRLQVLARIPESRSGRSITVGKLERHFSDYLSPESVRNEVVSLLRDKFIKYSRKDCLQSVNGWAPVHTRVVAIELKLSRISEALSQASANRAFATHSYVALPRPLALRIARDARKGLFRKMGVGLLAVGQNSCMELIRPRSDGTKYNDIVQAHVIERFWRTRDS